MGHKLVGIESSEQYYTCKMQALRLFNDSIHDSTLVARYISAHPPDLPISPGPVYGVTLTWSRRGWKEGASKEGRKDTEVKEEATSAAAAVGHCWQAEISVCLEGEGGL